MTMFRAVERKATRIRWRGLVLTGALAWSCLHTAGLVAQPGVQYDLLIRGGQVFDGTGAPSVTANVAVRNGRIVAIGALADARATTVIDAIGHYVSPGFIDVHSHAGEGLSEELNHGQPVLAQGITTVVVNPDGGGPVDIAAQRATYEKRGIGPNAALFVPHGSIRREVLGMADRAPTAAELDRMLAITRAGMKAGAIGLSSGPYYAPGSYAKTDELVALAKIAAEFRGVYSSHIRDESDYTIGLVAAVEEVITVAEQGGLPGIVTHMKALGTGTWGTSVEAVKRIEAARARGVSVWADQYPYEASGTSITGALVPRWAQVLGDDAMIRRAKGDERGRFLADVKINIARRGGPATLMIARFRPDPSLEGKNLEQIARMWNKSPEEAALDLLVRGGASLVSFNMTDNDIDHIMKQPWTMTSTDGGLGPMGVGKPHPRGYGAFPRKLRMYVRERHVVDWPFAIRSMTSLPASVFGLKDRGVIREGAWADIVVINPAQVADKATYTEPHQLSVGIDTIVINGKIARRDGTFATALAGRVLTIER
ncbi:MAG TPA: D-aminoacylase [Vicinamibacterales bacterium]|nr:D-aminoacylase [Vicinamibacterales bacterium]